MSAQYRLTPASEKDAQWSAWCAGLDVVANDAAKLAQKGDLVRFRYDGVDYAVSRKHLPAMLAAAKHERMAWG